MKQNSVLLYHEIKFCQEVRPVRDRFLRYLPLTIALILVLIFAGVLMMYAAPMEDVSLDLSLTPQEEGLLLDPESFDNKGWSVYTQEGDVRTELTPNGFGGYTGLELGQTFYLSRVMDEELDSPTLQLAPSEWKFSVWLDDVLIYTDCPELDNRIGHLRLPVNEWCRDDPIIISLPADYQGKTLTIAQSFSEYMETSVVLAWPTTIRLYCGYAYESELISEATQTTLMAAGAFLVAMILLAAFVRGRDWSFLCLAAAAFFWLVQLLMGTSFYYKYFGTPENTLGTVLPLLSTLALLCFLTLRGGAKRKWLWVGLGACALSVIVQAIALAIVLYYNPGQALPLFLADALPHWLAFSCLIAILAMGAVWWSGEKRFYRVFVPLSLVGIALSWAVQIVQYKGMVWVQIIENIASGQVLYLYTHTIPGVIAAALIAAVAEAVKAEIERRAEQQLMEQRKELTVASYENLRRQHEEVMMMRHDMLRHYRMLHDMGGDEKRTAYLAELIGQNQKIRPVVESGNEMMDIILNGKLSAAVDAGIRVEIPHVTAPARLPLSDPDLCGLIMNIVDNAITAASKAEEPYLLLKIHERDGFLGIVCENSFDPREEQTEAKKETVPKHGLGLKIVKSIVARYSGVLTEKIEADRFIVKIVIPL